jgi:hypothetical protein
MKYCGQTTIPAVDNTPLECEKFISTDCIVYEGGIPYFGFIDDSSLTEVLNATITSLTDVRSRVAILELNASNLDHGNLLGLEDDDHTIYHTDGRALTWLGTRSTTDLPEGTNLYFTEPRVLSTTLTGFVAAPGTITAADSVLTALQKAQGALDAVPDKTSDLTNDGDDTVNPFINATDLPVNTDDLNNNGDDGINPFISATDLPTLTSQFTNDGDDTVNPFINATDLPTKTSELTNDGADGVNPFISAAAVVGGYVPYLGATGNINIGIHSITTTGFLSATKHITHGGTAQHFTKGDGSLDGNTYSTATKTSDLTNDGEDQVNPFITLLDIPADLYLGVYATLGALQTAHPTALAGNYANVDLGVGENVERYLWDVDDVAWVIGEGTHTTNTSELVNDGEDGVNAFITLLDLPDAVDLIEEITVGENVALGDVVYLSNDGKWWKTNAVAKATSTTEIKMILGTILADAVGSALTQGVITAGTLVAGAKYWLNTAAGTITNDVSGFADTNIVRYVGTAVSTTVLEFNPDAVAITKDGKDINNIILWHPSNTSEFVNDGNGTTTPLGDPQPFLTAENVIPPISELLDVSAVYTGALSFDVTAANYPINNLWYSAAAGPITLTAAHATLDRIDLIVADIFGAVGFITGTAAVTPAEPDYDPAIYYPIKFVLVPATATTLVQYTDTIIFDEGLGDPTEWNYALPNTGSTISTNDFFSGTKSWEHVSTANNLGYMSLTSPTPFVASEVNTITYRIKLKEQLNADMGFHLKANGVVIQNYFISNGQYGFSKSDLGWQLITVPVGDANLGPVNLDEIIFHIGRNGFDGFFLDYVIVQTDTAVIQPPVIGNHPTHTSSFINDGADNTSTYAEHDELGLVATTNDYNDLANTPIFKVIENEYADMATMYADQGNQTATFIEYVVDASAHPDVTSGEAWFEYLGTTVGDDTDYRLLSAAESAPYQSQVTKTSDIANDGENGVDPYVTAKTTPLYIGFAASDETTDLEVGDEAIIFRMPFAMTLTDVIITVNTAPTGSTFIADIEENGVSIFSTLPSIDIGEETSQTAAVPPVLSDTSMAVTSELTVNIDQVGSTAAGTGFKIWLVGTRT